ncbi:MAG: hypothetical protein GXX96_11900 [Planctomycetaceae bacterium]|nr:hypothetical protein [Planctomycetaceae bacterium]
MSIGTFFRRIFRRKPRPTPSLDYLPESDLPGDPDELIRAGVVREWRRMAATGEAWFSADPGAVSWFRDNLGEGRTDDA